MYERVRRLTPWSGAVMVAAFVVLISLPSSPDTTKPGQTVIDFYERHHNAMYAAAGLLILAALAGTLFLITCATFIRRRGADMTATACTVAAAVFGGGVLLASGTVIAANDGPKHMTAAVAQTLNIISSDLFAPLMFGGLGIAFLSLGVSTVRTGALPKALAIITIVDGAVLLSAIFSWFAFMAAGPLSIVLAGYLYARWDSPQEVRLPDVPRQQVASQDGQAQRVEA